MNRVAAGYVLPMSKTSDLIASFQSRYVPGQVDRTVTYYFSIGEEKHTLVLTPTTCQVSPGRPANADCVVKAHPDVFLALVLHGKQPGPLDIARGRFKTSDVGLLLKLRSCFGLG